jgi:hypothetical protein
MDILNADLVLFRDVEKWGKAKKYRRKRVAKRKKDVENDTGFHFVAYVPIDGAVWKLDGLQRQPDNLGTDLWLYQLISRANHTKDHINKVIGSLSLFHISTSKCSSISKTVFSSTYYPFAGARYAVAPRSLPRAFMPLE